MAHYRFPHFVVVLFCFIYLSFSVSLCNLGFFPICCRSYFRYSFSVCLPYFNISVVFWVSTYCRLWPLLSFFNIFSHWLSFCHFTVVTYYALFQLIVVLLPACRLPLSLSFFVNWCFKHACSILLSFIPVVVIYLLYCRFLHSCYL